MKKNTQAMDRAIKWIRDRGCSGVLDNRARMLAGGEIASHIAPQTWLRLISGGYVRKQEPNRFIVDEHDPEKRDV